MGNSKKDLYTVLSALVRRSDDVGTLLQAISGGGEDKWLRWLTHNALSDPQSSITLSGFTDDSPAIITNAGGRCAFASCKIADGLVLAPSGKGLACVSLPGEEPHTFSTECVVDVSVSGNTASVSMTSPYGNKSYTVLTTPDGAGVRISGKWPDKSGVNGDLVFTASGGVTRVKGVLDLFPRYPIAFAAGLVPLGFVERAGRLEEWAMADSPREKMTVAVCAALSLAGMM